MEEMRRDREARSAFRASMDSARTEMLAVLTPEQQKQVGRCGRSGGGSGGRRTGDGTGGTSTDDARGR